MNIVKLQKQLQNVPDNALVGYVKNPDGQVPSYLALTELNRRKELRKDYEKQAAPEKSVAESMIEEASGIQGLPQAPQQQPAPQQMAQAPQQPMPQEQPPQQMAGGGLAELDIPDDMFNEESYAGGGIVSFGKGGGIDDPYSDAIKNADPNGYAYHTFMPYLAYPQDMINAGVNKFKSIRDKNTMVIDPATGQPISKADLAAKPKNEMINAAAKAVANQYKGNLAAGAPAPGGLGSVPIGNMVDALRADKTAAPNPLAASATRAPIPDAKLQAPPGPAGAGTPPPRDPRLQTVSEIGYELPKVDIKTIKLPEGIKTLDYINQQKAAMTEAGVDPDFYAKQAANIAAEKEALKGQRSNAGSMALAKAGFAMAAGKSPFALSNIAEGAGVGLDQYGRDLKEIKADEKLLRLADNKLAEAQYLQSRGDAQGALAAMKERENLIFTTEAKNTELQNQGVIEESRQKADLRKTILTEQGANKRTQMQISSQQAINQADIKSRKEIATIAATSDLTKLQRANIDKVHDNAKAQVKLEIDGGAQYTPEQIESRINELTASGLSQMGYNIPGIKAPVKAPKGSLAPAAKGSGADFSFGF